MLQVGLKSIGVMAVPYTGSVVSSSMAVIAVVADADDTVGAVVSMIIGSVLNASLRLLSASVTAPAAMLTTKLSSSTRPVTSKV